MFARHCRRIATQNRAPGRFEGRKFGRLAREGCFDIRQLVCSGSQGGSGEGEEVGSAVCPICFRVPNPFDKHMEPTLTTPPYCREQL